MLAAQRAVAGIEQHQLPAGVHQGRNERMLEAIDFDVVAARHVLRGLRRLITAESGIQPVADDLAVHDIGDLEAAKPEAVDRWVAFRLAFDAGTLTLSEC